MPDWTVQRVEQMAPDAAAVKAAQSVANPGKWKNVGSDASVVWGECQGSGANPYQVRVDHVDVAYKCSCPSRKLPCKHTLGLLLLFANGKAGAAGAPPPFVVEWQQNRTKRAETRQKKEAAGPAAAPDPEAREKRIEKRESRVGAGLDQLESWLADIVAQGLAAARAQPPVFWAQMAARLIDAQAPGLARRVGELGERALATQRWQAPLLRTLGELQLLIDAYRILDKLPPPLAAEVRGMIGWAQSQEELRERPGVRDRWQVVGRRQAQDDKLRVQYTWLHGANTRRIALILEFAAGPAPLPANYLLGQVVDAELVFFDGLPELRALEKERHGARTRDLSIGAAADVTQMSQAFSAALAANPWFAEAPVLLGPVRPVIDAASLYLQDAAGRRIPVGTAFLQRWELVALAGSDELRLFGRWDGFEFEPLTIECRGAWFTPMQINALPVLSRVA